MASIWDFLDSLPKRADVSPEELEARRQGYADLYQGGLLARNRDQMPLSVQGAQAMQDFMPVIGDALALGEAGEALSRGELAAAGLLGAGAAIGLVPGAGDALAKPVMAAGRRAADIARRIEVDPNALGSMGGNIRLRPEYVSPAQEVAGLLSSGRAADVTDEMLAKFTPKDEMELFELYQRGATGMDLPMDEASRMARAREMGYEGGLLHGTGSDIRRVEPSKLGEKQNVLGKGFYQTTSPKRAERYVPKEMDANGEMVFAEGGNVLPLMTRSADEFDLTAQTGKENITRIGKAFEGSDFDVELRDGGDTAFIRSKSDPNFNVFLDSYAEGQNTLMRLKNAFGNNNLTPILQEAGFTGVKGAETRGSNVRVNYNPQDVRSRSARFDPRLAHLRNLSAGFGGLGLLGMSYPQEEQY